MSQVIGVLGGLGPQTTAEFYLKLIELGTKVTRPAVSIWSLPLNIRKEKEYIARGRHTGHYFSLMKNGLRSLVAAGSDLVVIPCNTVHEFHPRLARTSSVQIVNLIDIVSQEVVRRDWRKVLLLATSRTIKTRLYQKDLSARGVSVAVPNRADQTKLDNLIMGLLGNQRSFPHQLFLENLQVKSSCNKIVLGCTDLRLVFAQHKNFIDSMEELARHTATLI